MPSASAEPVNADLERAELEAVLSSPLFTRSPTLAHLLSYLCEKKIGGDTSQIKEYSIALEVFRRGASFDQDTDSIVRVEANRLRKRLAEYYQQEGASHRLRITIPVGQYVPAFEVSEIPNAGLTPPPAQVPNPAKEPAQSSASRWRKLAWLLVSGAVLFALLLTSNHRAPRSSVQILPAVPPSAPLSSPETTMGLPVGDEVRILAGASRSYVDRAGKLWGPDRYFTGGKAVRSSVQHIWRTQDVSIYRSSRQGDFRYDIPLKPGIYELRLHFAETFYGPEEVGGGGEGSRVLTVQANGKPLLSELDVVLDAGGSRTADVKVFTGVTPAGDGQLHLNFSSVRGGNAMLSAIEILPGLPVRQRPVRIATRDVPYYSNDSRWWAPDEYFKGGQLATSDDAAADTDDPEMYETERWGHFSYSIPVAPGRYTATFYFIEHRFDAANRDRYGDVAREDYPRAGGRLFSVFCNGKAILADLDLIKEAGENRPLIRRVSGLEPNAQGKLLLEFVPTRAYATVTAIEVVAQAN
jgi:hypothetical protein